ncbi:thermonuclease family protein [Zooshikella sp. RANM57]|uniref:thermonuclease family protein n=1 Tax=Zooshikella sp. RANM57 TaxID=3425863 RepID=UPI003D6E1D58
MYKTLVALLIAALPSFALADIVGKVVSVADGDTITVLDDSKKQHKIRFAEIDTPEKAQPYGSKAKKALSDLIFSKTVEVREHDVDRYGRIVGHVYLGGTWINAEMVKQGHAWVYRAYSKNKNLLALEQEAKAAKRGLWALSEAQQMPPWEWRKQQRSGKKTQTQAKAQNSSSGKCGTKRYCKEMSNCDEAMFYLQQCGLTRLDRDKDGVPCESLCK